MTKTQQELDAMQSLLKSWEQSTKDMDRETKLRIALWVLSVALRGSEMNDNQRNQT